MVQYGYPYETAVYEPVPASPAEVTCRKMVADGTGIGALRAAVEVFYNHTGQAGACFDFEEDVVRGSFVHLRRRGRSDLLLQRDGRMQRRRNKITSTRIEESTLGRRDTTVDLRDEEMTDDAYSYQTCTEAYQPMPTDGITDFEVPYIPNTTEIYAWCKDVWNVEPHPDWEEMTFMGGDISSGSNIFSQMVSWILGEQQVFRAYREDRMAPL
mmetsp:Transcript_5698/g.8457  ORF Transcript_5698/g.8457 Transcript_5698/m.8457 type:complete len:212 (+) Transcript_5698:710-1345(+)